jgi:hypothetical protein
MTKLLIHYGCLSSLGIELQVSLELLIIEMGILSQPFQESYTKYVERVTPSRLKLVWEKVDHFNVKISIRPLHIEPPRMGDKWFMKAVEDLSIIDKDKLLRINRV